MTDMDAISLHTLDTEAAEAAFYAALESLKKSDLRTLERLRTLAEENGVVGDAARHLLEEANES